MSSFYDRMQSTASGLLGKFGTPATFTRTVRGEYNYDIGEHEGGSTVTWTANTVMAGVDLRFVDGTRIEAGDMRILVDCKDRPEIPRVGDSVTFADGTTWNVMADMPVSPAGTIVLYKGIVRRG